MEQIENKMLIDDYWESNNTDWDKYYEAMAEKADEKWEDSLDED